MLMLLPRFSSVVGFLALLALLPGYAAAAGPYRVRQLEEPEILQMYVEALRDACQQAERDWKSAAFGPAAGFWGDGVSSGNQGLRAVGGMALASAALVRFDSALDESRRRQLLARINAALRYAVATHLTGGQKCPDGKPWGATPKFGAESWQSGMWTGTLGFAAWLVWDQLEPALRRDWERVVTSENEILAGRPPPNGLWLDTRAEENAWEVPCLVLGELMFPQHAHVAAWRDAARRYMMNVLCTEADTHDAHVIEGRPVSEWVTGANVQPDFTLENHNRFHPAYVACSSYFLTQAALYYTFAGRPVPATATHHLADTWRMFRTVLLPWGEAVYPQGMDWELHALPYLNLFAALGTRGDAVAAHLEQQNLQYLRAWQVMGRGGLETPGSKLGFTRHAINAEQLTYGFLAHRVFGPAAKPGSDFTLALREPGVWEYSFVGFLAQRTAQKYVTFSWKNRVMGQLLPIGEGHGDNPEFTVPIAEGFVGSFELEPKGSLKTEVIEHDTRRTADGFVTTGALSLNGGRLRQTLRLTSVGERVVVYEDRVVATADVTVKRELGMPLGIENDEITGGARTLMSESGSRRIEFRQMRAPVELTGTWANVDGRLGLVRVAGSPLAYVPAADYARGIAVAADVLYGSRSEQARSYRTGEEVAHRAVILLVETTPEETAALANAWKIESGAGGRVLRFSASGSGTIEVPLL
jgi:hypothetical protein